MEQVRVILQVVILTAPYQVVVMKGVVVKPLG